VRRTPVSMLIHLCRFKARVASWPSISDARASVSWYLGCRNSSIIPSACYGAAPGAVRDSDVGQHGSQPGERTQVLNRLEGPYGTNCLLLGCGETLNATLPFLGGRGGHGRAKRAAVPARAGDCTARRRRAVAPPIWLCILLRAGGGTAGRPRGHCPFFLRGCEASPHQGRLKSVDLSVPGV
jgi:hypothetical protein